MANEARLSFLGPVFNKAAWLPSTIENLQQQTLKDVEFIFVDDGSTDSTPDIIKHYAKKDKRIKLYRLKSNVGLGRAWNIGTKLVKSPIICVMSGDDWWVKERGEWTYNYFKEHKDKDVFYGAFYFCDYAMNPKEFKPTIPFNAKKFLTPKEDGFNNLGIGHFVLAYRTNTGLKYPHDESRKYGIDYPFICDLIRAKVKFGWTDKVLGYARLLNTGVSVTHRKEILEQDREYEKRFVK